MGNGLRIASCLLTVLLLGVTTVGTSFADEVGPGAHGGGNSSNSSAETRGSQPSSPGEARESGGAKLDRPSEARGQGNDKRDDVGTRGGGEGAPQGVGGTISGPGASSPSENGDHAIDTGIGMPLRRLEGGRSGAGNVKARVRLLAPRRPSTPGTFDHGVRNAIGMPVAAHGGQGRREGEHRGVPMVVPNFPAANAVATSSAQAHQGAPASVRADTGPGPGLNSNASNRGTIGGTGTMHPGASQQGIGGRAKTVAGISGTTVRSKH
jgi:hypothetical protein